MDQSVIVSVLVIAIPAVASIWVANINMRAKRKSDQQSAAGEYYRNLEDRVDKLQARLDEMQSKLDSELQQRRAAEYKNHLLKIALQEMVVFVKEITNWAENGSVPPPPTAPTMNYDDLLS